VQQRLDTTEELFHEAREQAAGFEQRMIDAERRAGRLQTRVELSDAAVRGRERALESIPNEFRSPGEDGSTSPMRTPTSTASRRSPLKVRLTGIVPDIVRSVNDDFTYCCLYVRLYVQLRQSGGTPSAEGARVSALQVEIQATLARAQAADSRAGEAERELAALKSKVAKERKEAKEEAGRVRAEAEHERSERAKLMMAMSESLASGKEGAKEVARLRKQVAKLERDFEAAEAAEAAAMALAKERLQELEAARAEIGKAQVGAVRCRYRAGFIVHGLVFLQLCFSVFSRLRISILVVVNVSRARFEVICSFLSEFRPFVSIFSFDVAVYVFVALRDTLSAFEADAVQSFCVPTAFVCICMIYI
jgi:hypothetical protein